MAVTLRSHSDLVYLPDHGFVGPEGALRILVQVTRRIRRVDISQNLLGSEGVAVLVAGLATLRHNSSADKRWGLREINLGTNGLDDDGLTNVLRYAKEDLSLSKVLLQGNNFKTIGIHHIHTLNSSHITTFSLTNNPSLSSTSIRDLFTHIDCPHLLHFHLSTSSLDDSVAQAISEYLSSSRSHALELLELNGNHLAVKGVERIIDAIETSNYSLKQIGLLANHALIVSADADEPTTQNISRDSQEEDRLLSYQVHQRLPPLLERNRFLTRRIRQATLRAIAPSSILLNARSLTDEETARNVIESVGAKSPAPSSFPLLNLPSEVVQHIARHCSQDPYAFSERQYARLVHDVTGGHPLVRMQKAVRKRLARGEDDLTRVLSDVRDAYLRRGGWDKWDPGP